MKQLDQQKQAVKWLRIVYPVWAAVGIFSLLYVPGQLIDLSNPELTITNISTNEFLYRLGIAGSLVTQLFCIVTVWLLLQLFYHDFKEACWLMAVFALVGVPIAMYAQANKLAVFDSIENTDQVILLLKLTTRGTMIATIFWGLWLLPIGYMIIKSPLFHSLFGWLVILAGIGYTVAAFAYFLGVRGLIMDIMDALTMGEVIWMAYVMIMGARWSNVAVNS